jgi:magnesium-transporting ATPase (P-type)
MAGKETIPYFITRNYKNIISRGVYITWVCFATYIIGAISLGILYGLQGLYEGGNDKFYFLFWKMGQLKSFKSEITINIVVLILTLGTHITNIVWSRSRKNNVIGYYGSSILPSEEERAIKKRANKICLIILCVVLAIVLFAIVIPWIILRRRRGQSVMPFGRRN